MSDTEQPVTMFGPDFPFPFDEWIAHPAGLGTIPAEKHGARVGIIGAGISGILCGYELMRMGVHPILYESGQLGGRLRSQPFEGADGVIAELGGMRFPVSSTGFYHYVDKLGLESRPFPNPLSTRCACKTRSMHLSRRRSPKQELLGLRRRPTIARSSAARRLTCWECRQPRTMSPHLLAISPLSRGSV